jgi:hypothetical protein
MKKRKVVENYMKGANYLFWSSNGQVLIPVHEIGIINSFIIINSEKSSKNFNQLRGLVFLTSFSFLRLLYFVSENQLFQFDFLDHFHQIGFSSSAIFLLPSMELIFDTKRNPDLYRIQKICSIENPFLIATPISFYEYHDQIQILFLFNQNQSFHSNLFTIIFYSFNLLQVLELRMFLQ